MAENEQKTELTHDALQERAEKLVALLKEREVGIFVWHTMLNESLKEFHDLICPLFRTK